MPTAALPRRLLRREKTFGRPQGSPLDRNAKVRIIAYARGYNAKHRQKGQHWGPLTRTTLQVLEALLWGFHNSRDGACFPSYETIAARAKCNRDSVYEAIKALEFANVLTWVNCLTRIKERIPDLFGQWASRWRVIRTSNAYLFCDPLPCQPMENRGNSSKSEKPSGTQIQALALEYKLSTTHPIDPDSALWRAFERLGRTIEATEGKLI